MPTEKPECWTHSLTFSFLIQGAGSFPSCGSVPKHYGKMERQILLPASGWLDLLSLVIESSQLISWGKKGRLVHVLLWNQCVHGRENDRSLPVPSSCSTVTVFKHTHTHQWHWKHSQHCAVVTAINSQIFSSHETETLYLLSNNTPFLTLPFSSCSWRSQGKNTEVYLPLKGLPFPSPVDHVLFHLSAMTQPSWVALHGMAQSFIELHKAVTHVIILVSFLWLWIFF